MKSSTVSELPSMKEILKHTSKYSASFAEAMWISTVTIGSYGMVFMLMAYLIEVGVCTIMLIPLSILLSGIIIRLFSIQHDCGHGSFLPKNWPRLNISLCFLMSILTNTPTDWRNPHRLHHLHIGNEDQNEYSWGETVWHTRETYNNLSNFKKCCYKILRHPIPFFTIIPILQWWFSFRIPDQLVFPVLKYLNINKGEYTLFYSFTNKMVNNFFMVLRYTLIINIWGKRLLFLLIFSEWFATVIGMIMFHVQHVYDEGYLVFDSLEWNRVAAGIYGSSFLQLPDFLKWFTMGLEYHHIHHISTKIPGYKLQKCHEEAPPNIFPEDNIVKIDFKKFIRSIQLQVYDETIGKYVTFSEIEKSDKID